MILQGFTRGSVKVPVDVMIDGEWQTFETISGASDRIGVSITTLRKYLRRDKPVCKGYQIKYHNEQNMF